MDETTRQALREAKSLIEKNYKNINGVAIGFKYKDGKKTNEPVVVVYVKDKKEYLALPAKDRIPTAVTVSSGKKVNTDVQKADFSILVGGLTPPLKARNRPLLCGYSIGHPQITAGTLGCFVRDKSDGSIVGLSNNHVLANSNNAKVGDAIIQPGIYDGGGTLDVVGALKRFKHIESGESTCNLTSTFCTIFNSCAKALGRKSRVQSYTSGTNLVDAAVFTPIVPYDSSVPSIGTPTTISEVDLGDKLHKLGRTTGYTTGEVIAIEATINVQYPNGIATFTDQIVADEMCQGGDSGSAVFFDGTSTLVGLLFAGGNGTTIINRIQNVFNIMGLEIA